MPRVLVNWIDFPTMVNGLWTDLFGTQFVCRKERVDLNTMLKWPVPVHGGMPNPDKMTRMMVEDPQSTYVEVEIKGD